MCLILIWPTRIWTGFRTSINITHHLASCLTIRPIDLNACVRADRKGCADRPQGSRTVRYQGAPYVAGRRAVEAIGEPDDDRHLGARSGKAGSAAVDLLQHQGLFIFTNLLGLGPNFIEQDWFS